MMTGPTRDRIRPRARPTARTLLTTTALTAAMCGLGAVPSLAANAQEAENLRRDIARFIADTGYPEWTIESGEVTVEVVDDGYEFVIPDLVIVYDQPPEQVAYGEPGHAVVTLDDLNLRIVPDPVDPDLLAVDARFGGDSLFGGSGPVRFTVDGGEDRRVLIDIADHAFTGTWSNKIGYLTDVDLSLADIVAAPGPESEGGSEDGRVTVGLFTAASDMTEVAPGLWDGSSESTIENIVAEADGEVPFRLGRFTMTQTIAGFAFDDYMEWVRTSPVMMGEQPEFASDEEAGELIRQTVLDFPRLMDDFSIGWTLSDLDAGDARERVLIEQHEFMLAATGLADDLSDWQLHLLLQGMTMPQNEVPAQFVPIIVDISIGMTDLPTGLGWQAMEDAVGQADIADMDMIGPMLGQQITQLTLESGTGMDLGGEIGWETGNITFTGAFQADPSSPLMASGGLNVVFNKMQEFIREVEATMGAETAGPLTMVQAFGQQEEGRTVYDFQISGSDILMNGQDLQPMMQMLGR